MFHSSFDLCLWLARTLILTPDSPSADMWRKQAIKYVSPCVQTRSICLPLLRVEKFVRNVPQAAGKEISEVVVKIINLAVQPFGTLVGHVAQCPSRCAAAMLLAIHMHCQVFSEIACH